MHSSSELESADFRIDEGGEARRHADWSGDCGVGRRLGVIAPNRVDAVGAATLIMAYVTAFYDRYRERGEGFFVYPDYFSFQSGAPLASYGNFDIWPERKSVAVGRTPGERLDAVTDRGVQVLLLPDRAPTAPALDTIQLAAARRCIDTCYLYAADGELPGGDLAVSCPSAVIGPWLLSVFATVGLRDEPAMQELHATWSARLAASPVLRQTYRRVSLDEALSRL